MIVVAWLDARAQSGPTVQLGCAIHPAIGETRDCPREPANCDGYGEHRNPHPLRVHGGEYGDGSQGGRDDPGPEPVDQRQDRCSTSDASSAKAEQVLVKLMRQSCVLRILDPAPAPGQLRDSPALSQALSTQRIFGPIHRSEAYS